MDTITIEELGTRLGIDQARIIGAIREHPEIKQYMHLDPEPTGEIYRSGDSSLTITPEGGKELSRILGLDPALLDG